MDDHDVQHMLEQLNLTQYASALQEGGYDDLESMISDFQDNNEELKAELVNDVGMKKPHSRKLLRHLSSLSQLVAAQPPLRASAETTETTETMETTEMTETHALTKMEPPNEFVCCISGDVLTLCLRQMVTRTNELTSLNGSVKTRTLLR